jgi:Protein of unknown function (DUF2478)
MSVTHSALAHELATSPAQVVAAIIYADNAYPDVAFAALVERCRSRGLSLAGVLQHRISPMADRRCDVVMEDLRTGHRTALFENRGTGAAGVPTCRGGLGRSDRKDPRRPG